MRVKVTTVLILSNLVVLLLAVRCINMILFTPALPRAIPSSADIGLSRSSDFGSVFNEALLNNPLFTPSRQALSDPEQEQESAPVVLTEPPRLVGVIQNGSAIRLALLETATRESRGLIKSGQMFDGWMVTDIHHNEVTLRHDSNAGETLSLRLHPIK